MARGDALIAQFIVQCNIKCCIAASLSRDHTSPNSTNHRAGSEITAYPASQATLISRPWSAFIDQATHLLLIPRPKRS
jgi:hypothetical protein